MVRKSLTDVRVSAASAALLTLALSAGTASAVFVPKCSPPGGCAGGSCADQGVALSQARKMQPTIFSQGGESDFVVTPRTWTSFGGTNDEDVTVFAAPEGGAQEHQVYVFRQNNGGDDCQVTIEDGDVRVIRNGQPVAGRFVQREGDQIRVMGQDGNQVMIVRVPEGNDGAWTESRGNRVIERRIQGQPGQNRQVRILRGTGGGQGGGTGGGQTFEWHVEAQPSAPTPPPPPGAPQFRIQRRGGDGQVIERQIQVAPTPGARGQFRAIEVPSAPGASDLQRRVIRLGTPEAPPAPAAPQTRVRVQGHGQGHDPQTFEMRVPSAPTPPTPPSAPRAPRAPQAPRAGVDAQISGQVIIVGPDGQRQTIDLGDHHTVMVPHAQGGSSVRTFTVPGGQGQVIIERGPDGGQGGNVIRRRVQAAPAAPRQGGNGACCDCECCGGAGGSAGAFQPGMLHNQTLDLGGLHEHLQHLQGLGNLQIEGLDLGNLHQHLGALHGDVDLDVQGLHGMLQGLNLDSLGDQIQLEVLAHLNDALGEIDGDAIELEIRTEIQDAMDDVHEALGEIDWQSIPQEVRERVHAELQNAMREVHGNVGQHLGALRDLHATGDHTIELMLDADDSSQPGTPAPEPRRAQRQQQELRVTPQVRVQPQVRTRGGQGEQTVEVVVAQPRVMIGITMGEAPEDVLESLGVEGSAIRVEHVIEGLPAAEAGLKDGAIIVAIDGQEPASTTLLREILKDKEPGDDVTLTVLSRGRRSNVEVLLKAYDAGALQSAMGESDQDQPMTFNWSGEGQADSETSLRIREAIRAMTESGLTQMGTEDQEELRQKIDAIVREHLQRLQQNGQGTFTYTLPPGALVAPSTPNQRGGMVFVQPTPPAAPAPPAQWREGGSNVDARLNELSGRLDRLEQRLDRLAELLERRQRD